MTRTNLPTPVPGLFVMPRLEIDRYLDESSYHGEIRHQVAELGMLGYCVFGGTPETLARTLDALQELRRRAGGSPLLFSADCEFGLPMRLREGGTEFPDAMAVARAEKSGLRDAAHDVAACIGKEMRLLGLHWNFAPVADINSNPRNPIISTRSFGESSEIVSEESSAFFHGLSEQGILATAKHFPGHGDTSQDSHRELPYLNYNLRDFEARELDPFARLIAAGIPSVMTAHIAIPELAKELGAHPPDDMRLPASLSPFVTNTLLRQRMGFGGVVVTDALEMGAITDAYGATEAARRAWVAGADVILMPSNVDEALRGVEQALSEAPDKAAESGMRIHRMLSSVPPLVASLDDRLRAFADQLPESQRVSDEVAASAIEIRGKLPIGDKLDLLILVDDRAQARAKAEDLRRMMAGRFARTTVLTFDRAMEYEINTPCVICTLHRARGYIGGVDRPAIAQQALERLAERYSSFIQGLIMIGSPYIEDYFDPQPSFRLKTFSESRSSIQAAARVLLEMQQ